MKINKLNYEVYAIDYIDGTLPNNLKAEMENFLNANPDIAKDIAMMGEMQLVPDTSIKYIAKNDLKKPMSFSILNYMNWIVPVSLSIAFMIAYPSIRTLWHSDEATSSGTESQEIQPTNSVEMPTEPVSMIDESPISEVANVSNVSKETIAYNTLATASGVKKVNNLRYSADISQNNATMNTKTTSVVNNINYSNNSETTLANHSQSFLGSDEEKSIIDFSDKITLNISNQLEELDFLASSSTPLLDVDYTLDIKKVDDIFSSRKGFLPYLSFTIVPLSAGNDMAKTTNITSDNQLVKNLPLLNGNEIIVSNPRSFGIETDVHLSELFKVGTGFMITNRNILYSTSDDNTDLDIRYRTYSIPFMAALKMPLGSSGMNTLNFKGGAVMNWMGEMNYQPNNHIGSVDLERANTASLFNETGNSSQLITTNDELTIVPALQFGLEYTRQLSKGQISFALDYNRQMSNINTISIWDYDIDTQFRSNQTSYNMRYESVTASVKYTLPYRWYLKRK